MVEMEWILTMAAQTNFRVLHRSRRQPECGDIFVMGLPDTTYLFGRVIIANAPQTSAPMPGAHLIYIYDHRSPTPTIDKSKLLHARFLIPPIWTNNLGWSKGYFQTIANHPLGDFDVLPQHCFLRVALRPDAPVTFVDEHGLQLKNRSEPCGEWGLVSYRWIDDRVSDAVGIPKVQVER